jgi:hypothetical protein
LIGGDVKMTEIGSWRRSGSGVASARGVHRAKWVTEKCHSCGEAWLERDAERQTRSGYDF